MYKIFILKSIKYLLSGLTVSLLMVSIVNAGEVLSYKYNDKVVISIANVPCPHKEIKKEFPYGAVAKRIDGEFLFGCFKKEDNDTIKIQWMGGDSTVIPANYFLSIEPTL